MAQFNFEGDLNGISEPQLKFISDVIKEQGFESSKVTIEPVGKAGDNYAANVKRINIEGENENMTIVAKIAPTLELFRQFGNTSMLFRSEHVMYTEVLPKFVQLQKDAGIPENEQLKYAKCYGSFSEQPNEVILLEDLKTLDFAMLDRFQSLSNECVKSVLKNFASYHSLSYVLKHKEPQTYAHFQATLMDMWALMAEFEPMKMFYQGFEAQALSVLENPEHINAVKHKVAETMSIAAKFAKTDENDKYTVIIQGDAWTNNIMFRMEGDKVLDSIMIDYQQSRSSNPVVDLMYMIFNCTDYETRKQHYYDWLDFYHSELEKSLSEFNLKVNLVYPREKLDADLKRHGQLMLGMGIAMASMLTRKSEDVAQMMAAIVNLKPENMIEMFTQHAVSISDDETRTLYKNKIEGLIESFIEFGLL